MELPLQNNDFSSEISPRESNLILDLNEDRNNRNRRESMSHDSKFYSSKNNR